MVNGLKKSLFWSFMEQGGISAVGFIVQVVLARLLSPEAFGVMAILLVFTSLIDSIAQSGLGMSLIQKDDADEASFSTAFWLSLCLSVTMYILLFVGAPFISSFYRMEDMTLLLRVLGLTVLFNAFNSIQRSYLQREIEFKRLFKANFLGLLISGAIGIGLAALGYGIWALVGQSIAQSICLCLALLAFVPWRPSLVFNRMEAKELFGFGWKLCATGLINTLQNGIADLVIGKACDATELGYYSQGKKYPTLVIGIITKAISNVLFPVFARMKGDMDALRESLRRILSVGTFVIAPLSLLFCVIAEPVVLLILGEKWLPSVFIFQLTFGVNAILMFQIVNLRAYMALGKSDLYLKVNVIRAAYGIVLICATAIATKDIYLTAVVMSLCNGLGILFVDMPFAKKTHGYGALEQIRDQLPTLLISLLSALIAMLCTPFIPNAYVLMIVQIIAFGAFYISVSFVANKKVMLMCLEILGVFRPHALNENDR